jgi:hypothetical protein
MGSCRVQQDGKARMIKTLFAFSAGAVVAGGLVYFAVKPSPPEPVLESLQPPVLDLTESALRTLPEPESEPASGPEPTPTIRPEPAPAAPPLRPFRFEPAIQRSEPSAELPLPPRILVQLAVATPPDVFLSPARDLPPPPEPNRVTLPAGTVFNVILAEGLSSEKNFPGDEFVATLDRPLVIDGFIIADRDGRMEGLVVDSLRAGRVKGASNLAFRLIRLHTSDGQVLDIETDTFEVSGGRQRGRDVAKIGGAASIGAMVGGIAGGGAGAAIGAAIGGAAGTGAVLATRGTPARLAAETRLPIRLSVPLTITEQIH